MPDFEDLIPTLRQYYRDHRWVRRLLRSLSGAGLLLIIAGMLFYQLVAWGLFGAIPSRDEIANYQNNTASEIYSSDSVLLGKYFLQERTNVAYNDLPKHLVDALIATEDVRFYKHKGVDLTSLMRVAFKTLLLGNERSGGGSTITQQLAKNLFPRGDRGLLSLPVSKVKEMIIARRLEKVYEKEQILALYMNTVSFGNNAFGVETASLRFFNKKPQDLAVEESALLVGMLKATTLYNPQRNPERSLERRNVVLGQMEKYGFLESSQVDSLQQLPIQLNFTSSSHNEGPATYFREYLRNQVFQWCQANTKEDGSSYNPYTDGLKIYTTIDSRLQLYAEQSVMEHMKELQQTFYDHWGKTRPWYRNRNTLLTAIRKSSRYQDLKEQGLSEDEIQEQFKQVVPMKIFTWEGEKDVDMSPLDSVKHYLYFLNAGFIAMDPRSGEVLAWVGGIDHKYFKYDHVNINTRRQVGSIFKPVVYAAAIENGVQPCDFVSSKRITYTNFDNWSPGNADENYDGHYSVQGALAHSVNTVSVKVLKRTRISKAVEMAHKMGIESEIPPVPSIALGTPNLSLYEMVGAFSVFANDGTAVKPWYLVRITNQRGEVLADFTGQINRQRAMSTRTARIMLEMLKNVVDRGTAQRLRTTYRLENDMAGKTGTTQSHADGWFIGITPSLTAGAWVGSDDPNIHFRTITYGQGAAMALPIWAKFMQKVNKDPDFRNVKQARFASPGPEIHSLLDCEDFREYRSFSDIFRQILGDRSRREQKKERVRKRRY